MRRKIRKIIQVLQRSIIFKLDYINPRLYMKYYNRYLRRIGVSVVGEPRYIHPTTYLDGTDYSKIEIGDRAVISMRCTFLCHDCSLAAGFRALGDDLSEEAYYLEPIKIGNNVFIGACVTILPGTSIGDNSIIGAGAVVKGQIEPNTIMVGCKVKPLANTMEWARAKREEGSYLIQKWIERE